MLRKLFLFTVLFVLISSGCATQQKQEVKPVPAPPAKAEAKPKRKYTRRKAAAVSGVNGHLGGLLNELQTEIKDLEASKKSIDAKIAQAQKRLQKAQRLADIW